MQDAKLVRKKISPLDEKRSTIPRKPLQKRSRERFEKLIDATDTLLARREMHEIGLYDIAQRAKVPPASAYHFLPTKEAAFVALAERYMEQFYQATRLEPFDRSLIGRWSDLFELYTDRIIGFYNSNPTLLKLFFTGPVSAEIRTLEAAYLQTFSANGYQWMNSYFEMPYLPDAEMKFSVISAIYDGITMRSYLRYGQVTREFQKELVEAVIAYGRTFLPDVLPLRPPATSKAGRSQRK